jgi:hypothetical protein
MCCLSLRISQVFDCDENSHLTPPHLFPNIIIIIVINIIIILAVVIVIVI